MNSKIIIISHGIETSPHSEKINDFPFSSYNLFCGKDEQLRCHESYRYTLPENICKDTFDVNETIPVHIKSNGKRRIIIPQMKFHTSESDSENKKETCGIYLCNTIDGIYNNIKFEDHSFFLSPRTNADVLNHCVEFIKNMRDIPPLEDISVHVWSCRGNGGTCFLRGGKTTRSKKNRKKKKKKTRKYPIIRPIT